MDARPGRKHLNAETASPEVQRLMFECFDAYAICKSIVTVGKMVRRDSGKPVCPATVAKYIQLEAVRRGMTDSPVGHRAQGWQKKKFIDCKRDYPKYRDEGRLPELAADYGISLAALKKWGKELGLVKGRAGWPKGRSREGQAIGRPFKVQPTQSPALHVQMIGRAERSPSAMSDQWKSNPPTSEDFGDAAALIGQDVEEEHQDDSQHEPYHSPFST